MRYSHSWVVIWVMLLAGEGWWSAEARRDSEVGGGVLCCCQRYLQAMAMMKEMPQATSRMICWTTGLLGLKLWEGD